jgi:hypothetical protein
MVTAEGLLASSRHVVVTRPLIARASANASAQSLGVVDAGTTVAVTAIAEGPKGESWLQIDTPDGKNGYLPANRAIIGQTAVGYSLREIEVRPAPTGIGTLVDEQTIRDAVTDLRQKGRSISRVSVASPTAADPRLQMKLASLLAHALQVLEETGIDRNLVTAASGAFEGEYLRIRFFGT